MQRRFTQFQGLPQLLHLRFPPVQFVQLPLRRFQLIQAVIVRFPCVQRAEGHEQVCIRLRIGRLRRALCLLIPVHNAFQRVHKVRIGRIIQRLLLIRHAREVKGAHGCRDFIRMRLPVPDQPVLGCLQDILEGTVPRIVKQARQDRFPARRVGLQKRAELALRQHDDLPELARIQAQDLLVLLCDGLRLFQSGHAVPRHLGFDTSLRVISSAALAALAQAAEMD